MICGPAVSNYSFANVHNVRRQQLGLIANKRNRCQPHYGFLESWLPNNTPNPTLSRGYENFALCCLFLPLEDRITARHWSHMWNRNHFNFWRIPIPCGTLFRQLAGLLEGAQWLVMVTLHLILGLGDIGGLHMLLMQQAYPWESHGIYKLR